MSIFDSGEEHPPAKIRRYIITALAFVLLVAGGCWYLLRFHTEKQIVRLFLDAVVADWGPNGYYGPVKSYRIESAEELKRGPEPPSGVNITVEVSPYAPFPPNSDVAKQSKTKEVRLRVEYKDHSIGFAP